MWQGFRRSPSIPSPSLAATRLRFQIQSRQVGGALSGVQMRPRTNSGHSLSRFSVPLLPKPQYAEIRFIAEMYARACYSMLLVSANGPALLRLPVQATAILPWPRGLAIRLGRALLTSLDWL